MSFLEKNRIISPNRRRFFYLFSVQGIYLFSSEDVLLIDPTHQAHRPTALTTAVEVIRIETVRSEKHEVRAFPIGRRGRPVATLRADIGHSRAVARARGWQKDCACCFHNSPLCSSVGVMREVVFVVVVILTATPT